MSQIVIIFSNVQLTRSRWRAAPHNRTLCSGWLKSCTHCSRGGTPCTLARRVMRADHCHPCRQVVDLYFEDSGSKLEKLDAQLASPTQPDYNAVDQLVRSGHGQSADPLHICGADIVQLQQSSQACAKTQASSCRTGAVTCHMHLLARKERTHRFHPRHARCADLSVPEPVWVDDATLVLARCPTAPRTCRGRARCGQRVSAVTSTLRRCTSSRAAARASARGRSRRCACTCERPARPRTAPGVSSCW